MDTRLIRIFNVALVEKENNLDVAVVNAEAIKRGYLVHPDVCNESVMAFIMSMDIDYNATFYKEWDDVISKSRLELFVDQVIHYATTYGTEFQGVPYVPNDGAENVPVYDFKNLKLITPILPYDLGDRCMSLIKSGAALKNETIDVVCSYLLNVRASFGYYINVDEIKNREALVRICDALCVFPSKSIDLFRFIIYKTLGDAMIIKNKDMVMAIRKNASKFNFNSLNVVELVELSKIFYRFKPLFLAYRNYEPNKMIINKLRRLAKSNHQPMKTPFWNNVLSVVRPIEEVEKHLSELTNYKKVVLMQSIREAISSNLDDKVYVVRNGRVFIDRKPQHEKDLCYYYVNLYDVIRKSLVDSLKGKACHVKFPTNCDLVCPTSEKNFMGNFPMGTSFKMSDHNFIGIYWKNEWGTYDFDLSSVDLTGKKIGWNSNYYNDDNGIIYSGDMTNADPDASEVLYCRSNFPDSVIYVNRYNGEEGSKFKLFLGVETDESIIKKNTRDYLSDKNGYMVNPNTIQFTVDLESKDRQMTCGVVSGDRFYLSDFKVGNSRVSGGSDLSKRLLNVSLEKFKFAIPLKEILLDAGFEEFDGAPLDEWSEEDYIDLTNLSKDSLIDLFN